MKLKDENGRTYNVGEPLKDGSFELAAMQVGTEVAKIIAKKQADYGSKNILNCPVGAELGIVVRLYDKLARLANLLETGATPNNESIEDTIDDIMGYGMVLKMVRQGTFTLPLLNKHAVQNSKKTT